MTIIEVTIILAFIMGVISLFAQKPVIKETSAVLSVMLSLAPLTKHVNVMAMTAVYISLFIMCYMSIEIEKERAKKFSFPVRSKTHLFFMMIVMTIGVSVGLYWSDNLKIGQISFAGDEEHWIKILFALGLIIHLIALMERIKRKKMGQK